MAKYFKIKVSESIRWLYKRYWYKEKIDPRRKCGRDFMERNSIVFIIVRPNKQASVPLCIPTVLAEYAHTST